MANGELISDGLDNELNVDKSLNSWNNIDSLSKNTLRTLDWTKSIIGRLVQPSNVIYMLLELQALSLLYDSEPIHYVLENYNKFRALLDEAERTWFNLEGFDLVDIEYLHQKILSKTREFWFGAETGIMFGPYEGSIKWERPNSKEKIANSSGAKLYNPKIKKRKF